MCEVLMRSADVFALATTEIYGSFQILTEYKHKDVPLILEACERMHAHLTTAVVFNDVLFLQELRLQSYAANSRQKGVLFIYTNFRSRTNAQQLTFVRLIPFGRKYWANNPLVTEAKPSAFRAVLEREVLSNTVNGTIYAGIRARTTGAPQKHWFGPAGDPRGAGIGTPEAIKLVWSCHREIIHDLGPISEGCT